MRIITESFRVKFATSERYEDVSFYCRHIPTKIPCHNDG